MSLTGRCPRRAIMQLLLALLSITVMLGATPGARAAASVKAQYRAADTNATDNTIKPHLQLVNTGTSAVALSTLKARYYYSKEGTAGESFWCDWAQVGCANVTGTFAAGYLEIGFTSGAGSLAAGQSTGEIQARFNKTDWSAYNEAGDYSYDPTKTSFADWSRVTVHESGVLIWGTPPGGGTGSTATTTRTTTPAGPSTATATRTNTATGPGSTATATRPPATATRTSTATGANLVVNGGFETGALSPWTPWNSAGIVSGNQRSGSYAVRVGPAQASVEQAIGGLRPSTNYTLRGWARAATAGESICVGAKGYAADATVQVLQCLTATTYGEVVVPFTTGSANTGARIFCYKSSGAGNGYCDDITLSGGGSAPTVTRTPTPAGWRLVWSDEFNGPAIDTANWGYELGYKRNNEQQYYTNRPENARIESGNLVIEARRESYNGYAYTSASLHSSGRRQFQYGRFELRAKIPTQAGSWPAWWSLGTTNPWPKNGEIDMMEYYRGMLLFNVAYQNPAGSIVWDSITKNISDYGAGWADAYHIWVMEWDATTINLYLDGQLMNTFNVANANNGSYNPFRQPHYMLINLAIGGNNGGNPANTTFPLRYYVDYVRVYQR